MPTLLVTDKMGPALAARVRAAVRGRQGQLAPRSSKPRRTQWLRLTVGGLVLLLVFMVVSEQRAREAQLAAAKGAMLEERRALRSTLTPLARGLAERLARLIRHESSLYHGVVSSDVLQSVGDWDRQLSRPLVYARVATESVSPPERLDAALAESRKDAFVSCSLHPPAENSEKELMKRVNDVFSTSVNEHTVNVFRAHDAFVTLRVLDEAIDRQIAAAETLEPIVHLENTWEAAHIEARLPAVFGEVFLLLLDEPKVPGTPVELDGASVHGVRVVLVDVSRDKDEVLFRSHHDLNPDWVSERRRHQYARELEGCRLAYELRAKWAKQ